MKGSSARGAVLAAGIAALAASAQREGDGPGSRPATRPAPLSSADRDALREAISNLRRTRDPERAAEWARRIEGYGPAAGRFVLEGLRRAEGEVRERLEALLARTTTAEDAPWLLREFEAKDPVVRLAAIRRCAALGFADAAPRFEALLRDPDEEVRFQAALGLSRAGRPGGLETLLASARDRWVERGAAIRDATAALRGPEARERALLALRAATDPREQAAWLRLLAGVGDPSAGNAIAPYLDANDARVKLEAVNALRGMVEGAPPLDRPSTFDLVDHAKRWKERLGERP